ncbi:MAG: S8 family serine peptidase [Sphingobacteriaceae bacterium]|nr:S8 family serine peptidase [Sphingobacteriaceae bacterium]
MKNFTLSWVLLLASVTVVFGQVDLPALKQLNLQLQKQEQPAQAALAAWAKERGLKLRWTDKEGRIIQLMGVDESGMPMYFITNNVVAANSTATSRVWPGAALGYNLAGQGMTVGEWDGGATRLTHQEFGGRAVQVDGATTLSDHATHVAGTMIAAGVQPSARGMAYMAQLATNDWNNDNAEMTLAAQNGLLVSNHSYGQIAGWHSSGGIWYWYGNPAISETLDWNFGFYNSKAQQWDNIAVNNPFYLIVKSAGNNRNQGPAAGTSHQVRGANGAWTTSTTVRPPSGPYDCLPTYSVAKNILTIGAVNDLNNGWQSAAGVSMSSFSSWGPTDDGRIKPDIVGNGVGLYSSYSGSNTAYASISGTSMSGPNVAGSLILIQQHYQAVRQTFMRSATLKSLAIHTADEAGPHPGPDYMFGWGLLNTAKAVQLIDNVDGVSLLEERVLQNQQQMDINAWHPTAGPLKVSIAWTDPAGTVPAASLNPTTPQLVNDLDIRLIHVPTGTNYFPWSLDPANPAAAAQPGDNIRDNVEQVFVANAPPGEYIVRITHKGNLRLNQPQHFGFVATGLVKEVTAAFTANKKFICSGDSVRFTNASSGGNNLLWLFPGGSPATDTAMNPVVSYAANGVYAVTLIVTGPQGSDTLVENGFVRVGTGFNLPFTEDFETAEPLQNGWKIENPDSARSWELFTVGGTTPGNKAMRLDFFAYNNAIGQRDRLISPPLNLSGLASASLNFQHAYRAYSASNSDSLRIRISTDCQQTWTTILSVGGSSLATMANSTTAFVPNAAGNWCGAATNLACFNLSLNAFTGNTMVFVQFETVNGYGNNLYIDNIVVTGVPNVVPAAVFQQNNTRFCAGGSVQFSDQSSGIPSSRQWLFPGGTPATSTDSQPVVTYTSAGTYNVTLIVSNQVGSDTLVMVGAVRVDSIPTPTLTAFSAMCTTDGVLTLTGGSPAGGYYSGPGVINNNQFDPAVAGAGLHSIFYTVEQNGCTGTAQQLLEVNATPQPILGILMPQCVQNAAFTLTQGLPAGGVYSGPGVSNGQFDPGLAGVGTHNLTYTLNNNGCVNQVSAAIVVTAAPQASIQPLEALCTSTATRLLVGQPNGGTFSGTGVNFGVFNPAIAGPGNHTVTYQVNINGCQSTADIQVVVSQTPPQPVIQVQGGVLLSSASDSNQWYLNGQPIAGAMTSSYQPIQNGLYQVRVLNGLCSSILSAPFEVIHVGVQGLEAAGIRLYPNPSDGQVFLDLSAFPENQIHLAIYNAIGQEVRQEVVLSGAVHTLDLQGFAQGLYFVRLLVDGKQYVGSVLMK